MAQRRGPTQGLLLQDVILELQISNENVSGIETGVSMLVDSVSSLSSLTKKNDDVVLGNNDEMLYALKSIGMVNLGMLDTLNRLYRFFMNNDMIRAEEHRDLIEAIEDIGDDGKIRPVLGGSKSSGLLGLLGGVAALGLGFLSGFFQKIKSMAWYTKMIDFFTDIETKFTRIKAIVTESKIYTMIEDAFSKMGKIFGGIGAFLGKIGSFLGKILEPVFDVIRKMPISQFINETISLISKVFRFIMKPLKFIMGFLIGGVGSGFLKTMFNIGKGLAKVFSKLLIPITIIMAIVESAIGAFEGYKTGGIMGAIKGGLKGLLNSLIGWLIDIPKDIISWMLNMFGFENASKWLDSWNFASLFDDLWEMFSGLWDTILSTISTITNWWKSWSFKGIWQGIKDFFFGIWDGVINWLKGVGGQLGRVLGNAKDFIENCYKSILREILPDRSENREWYDPIGMVAMAIPDSVYQWANSPVSTPPTISTNMQMTPKSSGQNLVANGGGSTAVINNYNTHNYQNSTNVTANNGGSRGTASPRYSPGGSAIPE